MNVFQRDVLTLIKSALTQECLVLSDDFDMEQTAKTMREHHMMTVVYDGAVRCGISRQNPVMQELFRHYVQALRQSELQMREIGRIIAAFEENGIDYMPLKGCKMKQLYPQPELRAMGDADILIREDQYSRIIPLMNGLGFVYKDNSDHAFNWVSSGLYVELHRRLIPSSSKTFYDFFKDGWHLAKRQKSFCYGMSPEDEWLFLFTHFTKHYRIGGIGCRHVTDLWMYLRANPDMDEAYICRELDKMHLLEFHKNLRDLIKLWFEGGADNEVLQWMTDYIFASGSWGKAEAHVLSAVVRKQSNSESTFTSRMKHLLEVAFPNVASLRQKYAILQTVPWLLPLVWIYRGFIKLLFEPHVLNKHRKQLGKLTREKLDKTRQMLEFVGLETNF